MPRCLLALTALFETLKGKCTGITIIDSSPIVVCDNLRISRHRVFKAVAQRGKSSTGWFYGLKLHLAINHHGEPVAVKITPGNVDDRKPVLDMMKRMFGKLYADKGYISKELAQKLRESGVELVTKIKRNMKEVKRSDFDKAILKQRSLIETIFDELKNLCQIEHTRHRSITNCMVNLMAGLVAYCLMPNKPSLTVTNEKSLNQLIPN
jgi:transposase